jgi:hypothetical protein
MLMPEAVVRREALKLAVATSARSRYGALTVLPTDSPRRAVDVVMQVDRAATVRLVSDLMFRSAG